MTKEDLKKRTKTFAHACVKSAVFLPNNTLGNHVRGQLIRSSTSVAANYRAVCVAQSKPSFASKLSIVIEEVDESGFWLEFMLEEGLLEKERILPLLNESAQLTAIFIASRKTIQGNN